MKKIAIIGAGPAGIYTTLLLNNFQGEVHLFEQNKDIGEKLKTTGGGRMNVTNKVFSDQEFSSCSVNLYRKIFKNPHVKNRFEILKKLGIEYQWEKNRAILKSQNAVAEVARLKKLLQKQHNCTLHCNTKIEHIEPSHGKFKINGENFDYVILTTGGMYRMFDSGDAQKIYQIPYQLGHHITEVSPSLCALIFKDQKLRNLSGIAFEGVLRDKQNNNSVQDDILLTHFGISGPAALDFSAVRESENIELSFIAHTTEPEFIKHFNQARNGKQGLKKFLKQYLPERLAQFHISESKITQNFIADIPKVKLQALCKSIFHYPLPKCQPNSYPASWTTKGGVKLEEIKTHSLESKIIPNLFFAGEILDINGLCGGYNISFAMISAQIVADAILKQTLKSSS